MARQKHVYPTDEIPHLWAHATQGDARNQQGNLFFTGATLYSYRTSYPIARIFKKKSATLALHVANMYSKTTSQHCYAARRATTHMPSMVVVKVDPREHSTDHAQNLDYLIELAAEHLTKAQRVMTRDAAASRAEDAARILQKAEAYRKFFGIRRKIPAYPAADWTSALQRADRIENPDPASADKRERVSAQRKAMTAARDEYKEAQRASIVAAKEAAEFYPSMARRSDWRLDGAFGATHSYYGMRDSAVMLRLTHDDSDGAQIETSQGARIPAEHAPRIWHLVESVRSAGRPYVKNGHTEHAGGYAIDRVDVDGTMTAGCHVIPHSELRSMARALGLTS